MSPPTGADATAATIKEEDEEDQQQQHHQQSGTYQDPSNNTYDNNDNSNTSNNRWKKNGQGNIQMRTGKFTKEETEIIKRAVEEYCSYKQISVARLCSECDHKAELKGAWTEIAKKIPNRSVQSIYRHGLRQLHPFKRGAWTEEECERLVELVAQHGKKWATIQLKLNRSSDSCRDKYREMDDSYIRGRWRETETEELKKHIRAHLSADPNADLRELGKMVESEGIKIQWNIISKRMGRRSRLSCFKKWQKLSGLYSPSDQPTGIGGSGIGGEDDEDMEDIPDGDMSMADSKKEKASTGVNNPIAGSSEADIDLYLLSELASSDANRSSDVKWESLRVEDAEDRWNELLEEWQSNVTDDSLLSLSLSEIAQHILDRKTSAQRAAETVEAVDLPPPEKLQK